MDRMGNQEKEDNQERRVIRDLQVLVYKDPEDLQDHLVPRDRADQVALDPQDDLEIPEYPVGPEPPDPSAPRGLRVTVIRTPVWATMLEKARMSLTAALSPQSNYHPASSRTTARSRKTIRTATTSPTTRPLDQWRLMIPHWPWVTLS